MTDTNIVQVIIRAIDDTRGGFQQVIRGAGDVEKAFDKLKPLAAAVALAVAGSFAYMAKRAIDAADEMGKAAQKAGQGVEELSALKYAADQSGVSFEGLQTGLKQFSKTIIEARDGNKQLQEAFAGLGISIFNADGGLRGNRELLGDIANRFAGAKDGAEKTAMAMALFGKAGSDLIPLLNEGNAGIAEMEQRSRALGQVTTKEGAEASALWNDSLADVALSLSGVVKTVVEEFIPTFAKMAKSLADWLVNTEFAINAGNAMIDLFKRLWTGARFVWEVFQSLGQIIGTVAALQSLLMDKSLRAGIEIFKLYRDSIVRVIDAAKVLLGAFVDLAGAQAKMLTGDFIGAWNQGSEAIKRLALETADLGKDIFRNVDTAGKITADAMRKSIADAVSMGRGLIGGLQSQWQDFAAATQRLFLPKAGEVGGGGDDSAKGDLLGSRVTGEGKFERRTGEDEESQALKQRQEDLETLRQLHTDMRLEQLDGFALLRAQEDEQHLERLRKIDELKLTDAERLAAKEQAELAHAKKIGKINGDVAKSEKATLDTKLSYAAHILGQSAALAQQFGKKGFLAYQALAIGQTIISTAQAVMRAYADLGPVGGSVAAPFISALGGVQVGLIAAQKPPAAHGGLDYVPYETTYQLQRGERILSPNQNAELMQFMREQNSGGAGGSYEISVTLDGSTVGRTLFEMTRDGRLKIDGRAVR